MGLLVRLPSHRWYRNEREYTRFTISSSVLSREKRSLQGICGGLQRLRQGSYTVTGHSSQGQDRRPGTDPRGYRAGGQRPAQQPHGLRCRLARAHTTRKSSPTTARSWEPRWGHDVSHSSAHVPEKKPRTEAGAGRHAAAGDCAEAGARRRLWLGSLVERLGIRTPALVHDFSRFVNGPQTGQIHEGPIARFPGCAQIALGRFDFQKRFVVFLG